MHRSVLIPAVAFALLTVTAASHAQSDETFDAASVGNTTAQIDANGVVDDPDTDREDRAAALDDSIAAEEARLRDGDTSGEERASVEAPPEARAGDYGADDFRAPSDDELSAASEKARAAKSASSDDRGASMSGDDPAANDTQREASTPADDMPTDNDTQTREADDAAAPTDDYSSE